MARPREPVSVAGVEFDAMIDRSEEYSASVPEFPIDNGYSVSDNAALDAFSLSMTLYVTAVPITWAGRHGRGEMWIEQVVSGLLDIFFAREPITVSTQDGVYDNMVIEHIEIKSSADIGYAREIPIEFKQVTVTSTESVEIPDSYVRAGKSLSKGGKATTASVSSTYNPGYSSGSGSGSSGSSSSSGGSRSSGNTGNTAADASLLCTFGRNSGATDFTIGLVKSFGMGFSEQ